MQKLYVFRGISFDISLSVFYYHILINIHWTKNYTPRRYIIADSSK